jgi:hypothetical protein
MFIRDIARVGLFCVRPAGDFAAALRAREKKSCKEWGRRLELARSLNGLIAKSGTLCQYGAGIKPNATKNML